MSIHSVISKLANSVSNIFVFGNTGYGKTALIFLLLERLHEVNPNRPCYVVGYPRVARSLLPDWVYLVDSMNSVPVGAFVVRDDVGFAEGTSSMTSPTSRAAQEFVKQMALSRQKLQTTLFSIQSVAWASRNAFRAGRNVMFFKYMDRESITFERAEYSDFLKSVMVEFAMYLADGYNIKELCYCSSPWWSGMFLNGLASFWSSELSHILSGELVSDERIRGMGISEV